MPFLRRHVLLTLLAAPLARVRGQDQPSPRPEGDALLSPEQEARIKKFLPRCYPKLQRRDPVFTVVCGDEINTVVDPAAPAAPPDHLTSWYGRFLDRLGGDFYYHGGVVDMLEPSAGDAQLAKQWEEYRKRRAEFEKTGKGTPPAIPGVPEPPPGGQRPLLSVNDIQGLSQAAASRIPNSSSFFSRSFAEKDSVAVQILEPLHSLVFHTDARSAPDLVVIACGARDALLGTSLASFRAVLETAISICRSKGTDIILAGPPPALDEADERAAIGRARPWAAVMREVAEAAGIFFADLGAAAVYQPSNLLDRTPESTFRAAIEPVRALFDHGTKVQDGFHPNAAGHLRMGETVAAWLKNGEPVRPFSISGRDRSPLPVLTMTAGPNGEDILTLRVPSLSKNPQTLALCPLRFTGWTVKPRTPDRVHTFVPGRGARLFVFFLQRNGEPLPGDEEFARGSFIISDDEYQHLVDVKVLLHPLALLFPEQRLDGASGDALLKCTLVNTGPDELDASLALEWHGRQTPLQTVKVAAGERQAVPVRLPLPPVENGFRFKDTAGIVVSAEGRSWKFTRRIEGLRHAGLHEKLPLVPLAQWSAPAAADPPPAAVELTVTAHQTGIFFLLQVPAETVSDFIENKPWGRLEVQIDGRGPGKNGTAGCISPVIVEIPREDGRGRILPVKPAAFGGFYPYPYDPKGFVSKVTTAPDGARRIEFNMARIFLPAHKWSLDGSGQNTLGVNLRLFLCDAAAGGYSDAKTWVLAASMFPPPDARSLALLELRGKPSAQWSLRIG